MASTPGYFTSVGKKILIALTGIGLMLFLMGHVSGNLLIFIGDDTFNSYGHTLISNPLILVIEAGLVGVFVGWATRSPRAAFRAALILLGIALLGFTLMGSWRGPDWVLLLPWEGGPHVP